MSKQATKKKHSIINNPPPLGSVWSVGVRFQIIDGSHWQTIASCMDTPNTIEAKLKELYAAGHKRGTVWLVGDIQSRTLDIDWRRDK